MILFLISSLLFNITPSKINSGYILKGSVRVYSRPVFTKEPAGIIKGRGFFKIIKRGRKCKYGKWYKLNTGHWVCSGWFIPSSKPAGGLTNWTDVFHPGTYYQGLERHSYFAETLSKLGKGIFRRLRKLRGFLPVEQKLIADFPYFKTYEKGYIPSNKVKPFPKTFLTGLTVSLKKLPFAVITNPAGAYLWLKKPYYFKSSENGRKNKIRCNNSNYQTDPNCWRKSSHKKIRRYSFRAVKNCSQNFCRIRSKSKLRYYLRKSDITVAKKPPAPPETVSANTTWVDVELSSNTAYAFKGKKLVKLFLISASDETPTGVFKVYRKSVAKTFDRQRDREAYYLEAVPFILYFKESYAFHGAYWHDDFGRIKTHGCINLSPDDARWLFRFLSPSLPPGYYSMDLNPSVAPVVRIRK